LLPGIGNFGAVAVFVLRFIDYRGGNQRGMLAALLGGFSERSKDPEHYNR
jgi:hypothetical protein